MAYKVYDDKQGKGYDDGTLTTEEFFKRYDETAKQAAYQANLQRINNPEPEPTSLRSALGKIAEISLINQEKATSLYERLLALQKNPASGPLYNKYAEPTNRAVASLASYGVDTSVMDDNFFEQWDSVFLPHLLYNGTTNTPSSPGKKASPIEKAAYDYWQVRQARETTEKAQTQWAALQDEITRKAQLEGRNYTDDEIISSIDWSKYGELAKMYDKNGVPVPNSPEYNSAIGYSPDALYGVLWNARNNSDIGLEAAMANSYLGKGNVWKPDPELQEKLDNSLYSVGSTMEDMQIYFNRPTFDLDWLDNNRWMLKSQDKTMRDNYIRVNEAYKKTADMKEQAASFQKRLKDKLAVAQNPDDVMKDVDRWLKSSDYNLLAKMDQTIEDGYPEGYIDTTEAVNYSRYDIEKQVRDYFSKKEGEKNGIETLAGLNTAGADGKPADGTVPQTVAGDELTEETVNRRVVSVESKLYDSMSDTEKNYLSASPLMYGDKLSDAFYKAKQGTLVKGPANPSLSDPEWVTKMATKQAEKAEADYVTKNLGSLQFRTEYEKKLDQRDELQGKLEQAEAQYGEMELATKEVPDEINLTLDSTTGIQATFIRESDGKYKPYISMQSPAALNYMAAHGLTEEQFEKELQEQARDLDNYAESVRAAKEKYPEMDADVIENMPPEHELNALRDSLNRLNYELSSNAEEYNQKKRDVEVADNRRNLIGDITLRNSGMAVDPAVSDNAISYISSFGDWEEPDPGYGGAIEELRQAYGLDTIEAADRKELEGYIKGLEQESQTVRFMANYFDNVPADYKNKMQECADWLDSRKRLYEDYLLTLNEDFDALAKEGRELSDRDTLINGRRPNGERSTKIGFELMFDNEKDIYYALYKLKGAEAADQFYADLEGSLLQRAQTNIRENVKESAESGFGGRILNEVYSIASASLEPILNLAYMGTAIGNGKGNKWLRIPSETAKEAMSAVTSELSEKYKGTVWGTVLPKLAQMINDRGRSVVAGATYGFLFPEGASDVAHAIPISLIAGGEAYEEAIDNGLEPWQAWTLAAVNFACESVFEGIKYGNYKSAFPDGAVNLKSFKDFFVDKIKSLDWLEEGTGETATNIVERIFDDFVAMDQSERNQKIQEYLDAGVVDTMEDAALLVMTDFFKEDLETFITSSLSTFLDVAPFAVGKGFSTLHYARAASAINKQTGANVTARQLMSRDAQLIKNAQALKERNESMGISGGPLPFRSSETNGPEYASEARRGENSTEYDVDITILDNSFDSNRTTQTATIGAVLRVSDANNRQANAAAVAFANENGDYSIAVLEDMLQGGQKAGINIGTLKLGIQYAMLANGRCREVMNSAEFQNASGQGKAEMLAAAVMADATSESVHGQVNSAVHEYRVNVAEKELMGQEGVEEKLEAAQQSADDAARKHQDAERELEKKQAEFENAQGEVAAAREEVKKDPGAGENAMKKATSDVVGAAAVVAEHQQNVADAENQKQETAEKAERIKQDTMADIRQQAEAKVSQEEQAEAQAQAEATERTAQAKADTEAQYEAEAEAEQQANADREQAIRERLQQIGYSGESLERQVSRVMGRVQQNSRSKENMSSRLSEADGDRFLNRISKETGMTFEMQDLGDPRKNRGYTVGRNRIVLNSNLTKGQALIEAALHEVTHGIEETEAYKNYASFVLDAMYKGEDTKEYNDAIKAKIEEYANAGMVLTPDGARRELVAEYGRLNLGKKQFVRGLTSRGLGGKVYDLLSHAVSMLKGYTLDAEGRAKYQEMRTAMKLLREAIDERAAHMDQGNNGHTGLVQASITGWTDATGLTLEVTDDENHVYRLMHNGEEIKPGEYKAEMVNGTPVGNLIDMAGMNRTEVLTNQLEKGRITRKQYADELAKIAKTSEQQREYVAQIINMIGQYQDAAMVWELAGSLAFSSLKTNGDPQYSDSYDFGTICTKTQAILNAISETQVQLGRALTKAEIDGIVYEEVGKGVQDENGNWKHGATPCPPCYVYATWVNKPARLEKVRVYQEECAKWTDEEINEFMNRPDPVGKTKTESKELKTEQNTQKLWISLCLADEVTDPETGETKWVRKENPDICPNDILLDLRRSGDMAIQHPGTWSFMQKGGNAQGKAIAPYSDARLGESIVAKAIGAGEANARLLEDERNGKNSDYIPQFLNPFLSSDPNDKEKAQDYFNKALQKIKAQNLKGGQRWQSWSDFRAEWGSDYLMEMITMQALGSQVQTYTKVVEALDLLASAGFEVNMSLMPYGDGFWHNEDGSIKVDEDGNLMLRFSPVTGINPEAAEAYARKYGEKGNVQPMVVGISDEHIKAALAGDYITFVIPFHGSGGSVQRLQHLMSLLHEQMSTGNDYTKAQSDEFEEYITKGEGKAKKKINTNPNWALREAILTGKYDTLMDSQKDAIDANPYLKKLYEDRYINEDSDAFGVWFTPSEAQQIYPYEYWDTNTTLATADQNSTRFIEYCQMLGVKPRFSGLTKIEGKGKNASEVEYANFSGRHVDENGNVTYKPVKGYWKLLIDRSMYNRVYDENGKIVPEKCTYHKPQAVSTADINIGAMPMAANNTVGHSDDETRQITERIVQRVQMTSGQNEAAGSAVDLQQNAKDINNAMHEGMEVQNSSLGDLSDAEMDDIVRVTDKHYMRAVEDGDMEAAQADVDRVSEQAGYSIKAYHGTQNTFTEFDPERIGENYDGYSKYGKGFYFSDSKDVAKEWGKGSNVVNTYLKLENPYSLPLVVNDGPLLDEYNRLLAQQDRNAKPSTEEPASYLIGMLNKLTNDKDYSTEFLRGLGYDGIIIEHPDAKSAGSSPMWAGTTEYVVFDPQNIKSSDAVTYDDEGNVIPLSERFSDRQDIRYSLKGDLSEAEADQILASIGLETSIDRTERQNAQRDNVLDAMSNWSDGKEKTLEDVQSMIGDAMYPALYQWLHNTYQKGQYKYSKGKAVVTKDAIEGFLADDEKSRTEGLASVTKGWGSIVNEHKHLKAIPTTNNHVTNGTLSEREKNVISALFNGDSGKYCENKDTQADIYLDYKTIKETFAYGKNHNINPDVTERVLDSADVLLENAIYVGSHTNYAHPNGNVHYFASVVQDDGENKTVLFAVHDKIDKSQNYPERAYVAEIRIINEKGTVDSLHPGNGSQSNKRYAVAAPLNVSIGDVLDSVNNDRIRFFDKHSLKGKTLQHSTLGDLSDNEMDIILNDLGMINPEDVPYSNLPARRTNLPGQTQPVDNGSAQRHFGRQTAQQSDALHQEVKDYLFSHSSYTPDSNQAQIDRAMDWVQSRVTESDPDGYQAALNEVTSDSFDYRSADGQARMLTVMGMAVLKNDLSAELRLADAYNKQGTDLGRQLQARKIFRLMTPIGRQSVLQQQVNRINDQYAREGRTTRVGLSDETLRLAGEAQTEEEFQQVQKAAAREIAEQMPANWKDKLRGWRMLSMLGNPRTHIRNVIGNALFIPAVSMKNKLGAIGEIVTRQDQRTKTLSPVLSKEIRDFARQDAVAMKDTLTGEAKYNEDNAVDRERKAFKGVLQTLSDFNSNALEAEDWFFLKGHYRRALGGWMQANGYTPQQLQNNPSLLEQGRTYAVQEAQKATYRDFNGLAQRLNQITRNPRTPGQKVLGFAVEAALPFKKTPANILKRGLEYSPVGIAKSLTADAYHLKQYMDYQNGKLDTLPDNAISPNQFIDNICSGLTGTAIMAMGAILSSMGIVSCGLDDDDDEFEKAKGNQKYSIKLSLFGHDVTFTMDWAAPMSMPFFVGAAIQEQFAKEGGVDVEELFNALGNISEPVFNLSMLDGVNSLFKTSQYDDTNSITQILAKLGLNYATSFVPSLLGSVARTIDPYRRKAYVESGNGNGPLGTARYTLEQTENKIPGLSQTNIPYRDAWGNPETSSIAERILENFVLPGYVNEYKDDPVINEMERLYDATGEKSMIPSEPGKTITLNKEKHVLTAEQWDAYKMARGQTAHELLTGLLENPEYLKASEKVQAEMVKSALSYADQVGKKAAIPEYEVENLGNDPVIAIANDGAITGYKAEMMKALKAGDMETYDTAVEALREAGAEDSAIKTQIANTYRDMYKEAYRKGRYDTMTEIESLLDATGFSFDLNKWEKDVDEKYGAQSNQDTTGQYGKGNIDLNNRQVVRNSDGSISTVRSFSTNIDGEEVLLPTVIDGRIVSEDEAIDHYFETGEYLGKFQTPEEADEYAEQLSKRQDWYYNR